MYNTNPPMYNPYASYNFFRMQPFMYCYPYSMYPLYLMNEFSELGCSNSNPLVVNIEKATKQNNCFRKELWTGNHLQLTLMSIRPNEDIGLEVHPNLDQFIRIEDGQGLIRMGDQRNNLYFEEKISDDYAIIIPAGKWHNLINTGCKPLKLYSIYAPPEHPRGTIHETKADAEAAEQKYGF